MIGLRSSPTMADMARSTLLGVLLLARGPALAADDPPEQSRDPRANDLATVFSQACLGQNLGSLSATRAWALSQHMAEVGTAEGRKVYIGGDGTAGAAWLFEVNDIHAVLSFRSSTGACAIFGEAADPGALQLRFEKIVATVSKARPGIKVTQLKNESEPGPFGRHIGKVVLVKPFPAPNAATMFTLITNERPGGAYQVTMQVTGVRPQR